MVRRDALNVKIGVRFPGRQIMNGYPPHKMCPKCAVAPIKYYDIMLKEIAKKKQSSVVRKVTKDHHTKRTRRYGADEVREGIKEMAHSANGQANGLSIRQ